MMDTNVDFLEWFINVLIKKLLVEQLKTKKFLNKRLAEKFHKAIISKFEKRKVHLLTLVKNLIIKILNLKLIMLLEYQNIKIFLESVTLQISLKKVLRLKKLKTLCRGHMSLMILAGKKLLKLFTKKN